MSGVLIVDSDAATRRRFAALLTAAGHDAAVAADPGDALARLCSARPALLVGDLYLARQAESRVLTHLLRDLAIDGVPTLFVVEPTNGVFARRVAWIGSQVLVTPTDDDQVTAAAEALIAAPVRPPGLAHELNNLLTTIVGYSHLLVARVGSDNVLSEDLHRILEAADRAASLTGTFLSPQSMRRTTGKEPDAVDTRAVAPRPAPEPAATRGGAVLVVDDERPIRFLIQQILRRAGYDVAEAASPADAQAWLDLHGAEAHLVISDLGLPGIGSAAFLERLRSPLAGPKVLFMSGQTGRGLDGARQTGVPFLQKPFTADELLRKVASVLAS